MDFALFYLPTYRKGFSQSLNHFYEEMTDSVRLADRLGWQRVLTTEHHFHYYGGAVTNPAVMLAAWARETKNLRLGAGVSLVPLRHPLQVAEDYAMVDHLSGGRFDMGLSRGFVPHEFDGFGISQAETADRVSEAIDILRKFWAGDPFEYKGKFHSFPKIEPWPIPLQKEIPIWIAASNDRMSFERCGASGLNLMMNQYPMSYASLVEKHDWFKAAYEKAGHDPKKRRSAIAFMTYIADTEEEAIARARGPLQEHAATFRKVQTHNEWDRDYAGPPETLLAMAEGGPEINTFRNRTLICSAEQAVERIMKYRALGFTEAIFVTRFGDLSGNECLETIERLTKDVRPHIR